MQILYLVLVFIFVAGVLSLTQPLYAAPAQKLLDTVFRVTPEHTVERYYASLNDGISGNDFWDAYDLLSKRHQKHQTYDDLRVAYSKTRCIELIVFKTEYETNRRARVIALVSLTFEAHGMRIKRAKLIDHNLKKEKNEWYIDSFKTKRL